MSNSKQFVADGKKAPEKKNFTQACNLLNQYLKEKGSPRDLNINGKLESIGNNPCSFRSRCCDLFGNSDYVRKLNLPVNFVTGRPETSQASTIDFLSSMENPSPAPVVRISTPPPPTPEKSLPPLPQIIDVESYLAGKASSSSKPARVEAKTAAMTVFYGGQVMVFNDFSEEKVREIMLLANNSTTTGGDKIDRGKAPLTPPPNSFSIFESNPVQVQHRQAIVVEAHGSDLPIARRASLHKFLAKRKDRATARAAPYQITTSSSQKDDPKFDLNL